jgi:hypothetical protein
MVASVARSQVVQGPISLVGTPGSKVSKCGNYETFASFFRGAPRPILGRPVGGSGGSKADEDKREPNLQIADAEDQRTLSLGLAPEEHSVFHGGVCLEPSQWLSCFQGVAELPRETRAQQHAGVADFPALLERWVRRVAVGGDARRAVAKLDIGAGRFAGAELMVVAEAGRVAVEVNAPEPSDPSLALRLRRRLEERGYAAEVVVR